MLMKVAVAFLLAVPTMQAAAQDFQKGSAAFDRGDYAGALTEWRPLAAKGDAEARFRLGLMYARGQGVLKDDAVAMKWFRKAARQGHARAQHRLGQGYAEGHGADKNYAKAVKWCRKAAEQGYAGAQYDLGVRYAQGYGVPKNMVHAYAWWTLAASQSHQIAAGFLESAAKRMTPAEIAQAEKLAREWLVTRGTR